MREANLIPRDALVYRGLEAGVFLLDEQNRPVFQSVELGVSTEDDRIEVMNLAPATKIIGRGATMLREGDEIGISGAEAPAGGPSSGG